MTFDSGSRIDCGAGAGQIPLSGPATLLEDALNPVRFGGQRSTDIAACSPSKLVDLPTDREFLLRPFVYHLLGRLSASPTYVISDEVNPMGSVRELLVRCTRAFPNRIFRTLCQ